MMQDFDNELLEIAELLCSMEFDGVSEPSAVPYNAGKETFTKAFFRMLDDRCIRSIELSNKLDMTRNTMSNFRKFVDYIPKRKTVIALAYGMRLSLEETQYLMHKAGYHLTDWLLFDEIVMTYIKNERFNTGDINQELHKKVGTTLLDLKQKC